MKKIFNSFNNDYRLWDRDSTRSLPHVTERFYRVNKARSRLNGGSGLGLSIVEQIVKQHKGKLKIKSILGEGTAVSVMFPLMEEE